MKTYAVLLSALSVVMVASSVFASGADTSAYEGALFNGDSTKFYDTVHSGGPRLLSVGIDWSQQKRKLDSNGYKEDLKINRLTGILGIDATKWLTLYGGAGEADTSSQDFNKSSKFQWLAGGTIRVLDYLVLEPWNDIDNYWVGVDVNSYYRDTTIDDGWKSDNLNEIFGSVTMSFYSKPEKPYLWNRLGVYIGPAVSFLSRGDAHEDQAVGMIGGLQLNPTPNWGIKIEMQKFDDVGMGASVFFHF